MLFFYNNCSYFFNIWHIIKNNRFNSLKDIKHNYIIRAISSNISLDRFYSGQDELKIINELITLSNSHNDQNIIFLWPEGIIS